MTTGELRLRPVRLRHALRVPSGTPLVIGVAGGAVLGAVVVLHPELWRGLLAGALSVNLIVVALKWPRAAALLTLMWLPFLALTRRLLIGESGWIQNDPLLLVGPVVALALCYRIFIVDRRPLAPDRLSQLALVLLVMAFLGAFHPFGVGGVVGGLAGLIFLGVPLLWFFIGRELGNRRTVTILMYAVAAAAVAIGFYGMYQTEFGSLPGWDREWFDITGFSGVNAGHNSAGDLEYRPWGTFSSTSEYSGYLGIGLVIAIAMLYHRRIALAIAIPPLAIAVFYAGGRSVMALTLFTAVVLTALRTRNRALALVVVVLGLALTYGAAVTFGERLDDAAGVSGDPKVKRQVGGLLNPLDPNKSTFFSHWGSLWQAVESGFTNPIGQGTGASNIGARVSGGSDVETDIDIGDVFLSLGFVAGLAFIALIVMSFRRVFSRYLRGSPDPLMFAVAGILVVSFGQWLQGGHYAAAPLMWFLLGWAVKPRRTARQEDKSGRRGQPAWAPWRRRSRRRRRRSSSLPAHVRVPSSPRPASPSRGTRTPARRG